MPSIRTASGAGISPFTPKPTSTFRNKTISRPRKAFSQFAFNKNNVALYDSIYQVLMELKKTDGIAAIEPVVEVNYNILNGNYDEALRLCKDLSPDKQAERMAVIYHRMGKDKEAYEQMAKYKKINDSIVLVSHGNVVASCYVQMNNERMKLEQKMLEDDNRKLTNWLILTVIGAIVVILAIIIWERRGALHLAMGLRLPSFLHAHQRLAPATESYRGILRHP